MQKRDRDPNAKDCGEIYYTTEGVSNMRRLKGTKNFSPDAGLLWYTAALTGLLLFCFAPLTPPVIGDTAHTEANVEEILPEPVYHDDAVPDLSSEEEAPSAPVFLMQGDCGTDVYRLQTGLQTLGYAVGECSGVYTTQTASAVRRFQLDSGFVGDGVCTAAVSYAIAALSGGGTFNGTDVSRDAICQALQEQGYWSVVSDAQTVDMSDDTRLRNALILFQRTHGLLGSGEADYATLCALGMIRGADVREEMLDSGGAADAAMFDLRCRLLTEALADYVLRYPAAYDLYTLTACAAVLCSRTDDARFPGSFDAVCSAGLTAGMEITDAASQRLPDRNAAERKSRDLLLIRAAEDALRAFLSENGPDAAHGALYVSPAEYPIPQNAAVCIRTENFVFFR